MDLKSEFKNFYKEDWIKSENNPQLLIRFYSSIGINKKAIATLCAETHSESFLRNYPALIICGYVEDLEYWMSKVFYISTRCGENGHSVIRFKDKLPSSNYIIFSSPLGTALSQEDLSSSIDRVRANFDCIAALLRISFGNNFVRDCAYEVIVGVKNGNMQSSSEVINLVSRCQGPFLSQEAVSNFRDIGLKIATIKNENKIHLALQQLERASQENIYNKIIYYWIAIDTLLPKKNGAVYELVRKIYANEEINHPDYINSILGIELAKDARNYCQHDGLRYALSELQERYMHMLFQDLLSYKLNMPSKKYLSNFIVNSSFDINSFKEEQLKIVTVKL